MNFIKDKRVEKWIVFQFLVSLLIFLIPPFTSLSHSLGLKIIGILILLSGIVVCAVAFFHLGPGFTPFIQPNEKGSLVTSGIYAIVRHPMYSGVILLAFGWSILWSSLIGILLSFLFFWILDQKASAEERLLTQRYPQYATYKKNVKKFIPSIY